MAGEVIGHRQGGRGLILVEYPLMADHVLPLLLGRRRQPRAVAIDEHVVVDAGLPKSDLLAQEEHLLLCHKVVS